MKKPSPPSPPKSQFPTPQPSVPSSLGGGFPQPSGSSLEIGDLSPLKDPMDAPVLPTQGSDTEVLCEKCANCWSMRVAGQFKNRKSDGSEFMLTERLCMFGTKQDALLSLAERSVKECSRFVPKEG